VRIRLHRSAQWLRRTGQTRNTRSMVECLDELRVIAEHRRNVEGLLALAD
jgi:hypothetical protein